MTLTCLKDMNPELLGILPHFPYFNSYFMHLRHFHVSCSGWDFFVLAAHGMLKLTTAVQYATSESLRITCDVNLTVNGGTWFHL